MESSAVIGLNPVLEAIAILLLLQNKSYFSPLS